MITLEEVNSTVLYNEQTGVFTWKVTKGRAVSGNIAGSLDVRGYWIIKINRKQYKAHRLAWFIVYGEFPDGELDHIDMVKTNNSISNLRIVTRSFNNTNKGLQKNNTTGSRGVYRYGDRWTASISRNGKQNYLGIFNTKEAAENAYTMAFNRLFSELVVRRINGTERNDEEESDEGTGGDAN